MAPSLTSRVGGGCWPTGWAATGDAVNGDLVADGAACGGLVTDGAACSGLVTDGAARSGLVRDGAACSGPEDGRAGGCEPAANPATVSRIRQVSVASATSAAARRTRGRADGRTRRAAT